MDWPEITKDTSLEEVRRIHKAIWQYVVENGEKPKTPYRYDCVLCEYRHVHDLECADCPARWKMEWIPYKATGCLDTYSPYYWWTGTPMDMSGNLYIRTQLAEMIRDIPFKELDD